MTDLWQDMPMQFLTYPACLGCGTIRKPLLVRSIYQGDGSRLQRCVCRRCGHHWSRVWELPDSGNEQNDTL